MLVTSIDSEQLLRVPALWNLTGREQAETVCDILSEWNLENTVVAFCYDTTVSNMGYLNTTAPLLQQKLRHIDTQVPCSSGLNVPLC